MIYFQHTTLFSIFVRLEVDSFLEKCVVCRQFYWPSAQQQFMFLWKRQKTLLILAPRVSQLMTFLKWPSSLFLTRAVMILTRSCYLIKFSWLVLAWVKEAFIMTQAISVSPTKHSFGASQWITTRRSIHSLVRKNTEYIYALIMPRDSDFHLVNKSLPWDYSFRFVIEEISNINDKDQTMSISMYFAVSWLEPRLQINSSASEWTEDRTGPLNVNITLL